MSDIEILGAGKWLCLQKQGRWEWVRRVNTSGVVGIYCFTDADEVVLVEQPRAPLKNAPVLEVPAGLAGDIQGQEDEALERAARRELLEETGYKAKVWTLHAEVPSCPGLTEETIHIFTATGLEKVGPGGGDETEDITIHLVPLTDFAHFVRSWTERGKLVDPKVFGVPYFAALR